MADWVFKRNSDTTMRVTELPKGCIGFIYLIKYESGMNYIGKREVISELTLPVLKTDKVRDGFIKQIKKRVYTDPETGLQIVGKANIKRAKNKGITAKLEAFDVIRRENKWRDYTGSSKEIPKSDKITVKRILYFCSTKKAMTYLETKLLFKYDAPMNPKFYNKVIGRQFWDNDLDGLIKEPKW